MSNELLSIVIGGAVSLLGSFLGVIASAKLLTYRVAQLEQKFNEQCKNCAIMDGRVDKLEEKTAVMEEKIKVANHRIDNLEKKG